MRTFLTALTVTLTAALAAACDSTEPEADATPTSESTPAASPAEPTDSAVSDELDGTYRRTLTVESVRAALTADGHGKRVLRLYTSDLPSDPEFQLDLQGGAFRVSRTADDDQWMSGAYTLENGEITLDDEAPVGTITFAYEQTASGLRFRYVKNTGPEGIEWKPGVPDYVPALPLWTGSEWERVD